MSRFSDGGQLAHGRRRLLSFAARPFPYRGSSNWEMTESRTVSRLCTNPGRQRPKPSKERQQPPRRMGDGPSVRLKQAPRNRRSSRSIAPERPSLESSFFLLSIVDHFDRPPRTLLQFALGIAVSPASSSFAFPSTEELLFHHRQHRGTRLGGLERRPTARSLASTSGPSRPDRFRTGQLGHLGLELPEAPRKMPRDLH